MSRKHIKRDISLASKEELEIIELKKTMKAKDIAEMYNKTYYQVLEIWRRYDVTNKQFKTYEINDLQHQILISGKLGDGRIRKTRTGTSYVYSECHALDQKEYCKWKMDNLGDLTKGNSLYSKNTNNSSSDCVEFCTASSPSLKPYFEKSITECIDELNLTGLLLYILDDGWWSSHSKIGNFVIACNSFTLNEKIALVNKINSLGLESKLICERNDVTIDSKYTHFIMNEMINLLGSDIDIIKFKCRSILNND